jgi:hypothetical protein
MGGLAKKAFATMLALALAPSEAAAGTCTLAIPWRQPDALYGYLR